jgi:ELWxxDGT repeat protein
LPPTAISGCGRDILTTYARSFFVTRNVLLFSATGSGYDDELWESNGTAAGTFDITPGFSSNQGGALLPRYITTLNGEILFDGQDSQGAFGLWVSNGTAAGTTELGGIGSRSVPGANAGELYPEWMTPYNGEVLFQGAAGVQGNVVYGLWITNGTLSGTSEIGGSGNVGIANVYSGGLLAEPPDFTPFAGVTLFTGRDAANNVGLWETNGTPSGTFELAPISGAAVVGTPGSDIQPNYMAVLGNEVIFDGADTQDTEGSLWETNGTATGTVEIGGEGNAGIAGSPNGFTGQYTSELPIGIAPNDITAFQSNEALFAGYDNTLGPSGYYVHTDALWETNGTAGGTVEIGGLGNAGIAEANSAQNGGIFWEGNVEYPDFTSYGGDAVFVGYDSDNHVGLWLTDGTPGGTTEIGGLGGAGIAGGLNLLTDASPDFTVYEGRVYFIGSNSSGQQTLWVTNGTAGGTYSTGLASGVSDITLGTVTWAGYHDFTGTGVSELVWQNSSGAVYEWLMSGNQHTGNVYLGAEAGWSLVSVGDFNGDGTSDMVWQNQSSGALYEWKMSNGQDVQNISLGTLSGWRATTGDFQGNSVADIVWQSNSNGSVWEWTMSNGLETGSTYLGNLSGWSEVGRGGDFNGDGTSDLLWQNKSTGATYLWLMDQGHQASSVYLGNLSGWSEIGTGDFNGDGISDMLWQDKAGDVYEWEMNSSGTRAASVSLGNLSGWSVEGTGDYSGGGASDIVWGNQQTGAEYLWTMSNGTRSSSVSLGAIPGWSGQ